MNKKYNTLKERFIMRVKKSDYILFLAWWQGVPDAYAFSKKHAKESVVEVSMPQPWKPWHGETSVNLWRNKAENWHTMVVRGIAGQKVRLGQKVNCSVGVWPNWR